VNKFAKSLFSNVKTTFEKFISDFTKSFQVARGALADFEKLGISKQSLYLAPIYQATDREGNLQRYRSSL
jgi:hypothetical protein